MERYAYNMLTMTKKLEYNSSVILADKIIHSQKLPNRYPSTALHNIKNEITAHLLSSTWRTLHKAYPYTLRNIINKLPLSPPLRPLSTLRHCEERSDAAITSNYCQENLKHKVHSMVTLSNKQ